MAPDETDAAIDGDIDTPSSAKRSFSFLRGSRSKELATQSKPSRSPSSGRKLRKRKSQKEGATSKKGASRTVPSISHPYLIETPQSLTSPSSGYYQDASAFYSMDGSTAPSRPPRPVPQTVDSGSSPQAGDPLNRTESVTNRGRSSYASSANFNSPRRLRRRKDPTPFNILVTGQKNAGKSSFIDFLVSSLTRPLKFRPPGVAPPTVSKKTEHGPFTSHYLETELDGERVGVTIYDSKGLERHLVDLQLREMSSFLESKFHETFNEEQKVLRATGVKDTHIHCVFLLLDPARLDANIATVKPDASNGYSSPYNGKSRTTGSLDNELDVDILRTLQMKSTVIPVISKADTITTAHMASLKRSVWDSLKKIGFDPLEALNIDSDNESSEADNFQDTIQEEPEGDDSSQLNDSEYDTPPDPLTHAAETGATVPRETTVPVERRSEPLTPAPRHDSVRFSYLSDTVDPPYLPMSILSPDTYEPGTVGRRFPWGFADPYNSEHCDFVRLRDSVFTDWRTDLRDACRDTFYEEWRTSQMKRQHGSSVSGSYANGSQPTNRNTTSVNSTSPSAAVLTSQRAVSGAAAYGTPVTRRETLNHSVSPPKHDRSVTVPVRNMPPLTTNTISTTGLNAHPIDRSQIGVAIASPTSPTFNQKQSEQIGSAM